MNYVHVHKRAFLKQLDLNNNQRIKILEMIYASTLALETHKLKYSQKVEKANRQDLETLI